MWFPSGYFTNHYCAGSELGIKKKSELFDLLEWAALLHEVGLSINLRSFHRHSFYILLHSTLQGFNREQQLVLATLARFQRKALKLQELPDFNLYKQSDVISLIKILRLSIPISAPNQHRSMWKA